MKLLSFFLASSLAQDEEASDRGYVSYDYGFSNYGYGGYGSSGYSNYEIGKFTNNDADTPAGNGLYCWTCHGRLKINEAETSPSGSDTDNNAWYDCATNGSSKECQGEQRVCLTEERRRNEVTTEVITMCKAPEACAYLWRRNEKFMPYFHHYGDQSDGDPAYFDDECRFARGDKANHKFLNHRSQWESVCRHCCKADTSNSVSNCNGPGQGAVGPLREACKSATNEATGKCDDNVPSTFAFGTDDVNYSVRNLPPFMEDFLHFSRAHPGFGRNSAPADKFNQRSNQGSATLLEQADVLSSEDTDFHNNRADSDKDTDITWGGR